MAQQLGALKVATNLSERVAMKIESNVEEAERLKKVKKTLEDIPGLEDVLAEYYKYCQGY